MKFLTRRTNHAVYLPLTGVLAPDEDDIDGTNHCIKGDATAQVIDQRYGIFAGWCIYMEPDGGQVANRALKLVTYDINLSGEGTVDDKYDYKNNLMELKHYDMNVAIPIRPCVQVKAQDDLHKYLQSLGIVGNFVSN